MGGFPPRLDPLLGRGAAGACTSTQQIRIYWGLWTISSVFRTLSYHFQQTLFAPSSQQIKIRVRALPFPAFKAPKYRSNLALLQVILAEKFTSILSIWRSTGHTRRKIHQQSLN